MMEDAFICNDYKTIEYLLKNRYYDINYINDYGDTLLLRACLLSKYKIVKLLIKYNVNINYINFKNENALNFSISIKLDKLLIRNGIDINHLLDKYDSVLDYYMDKKKYVMIKFALKYNARCHYVKFIRDFKITTLLIRFDIHDQFKFNHDYTKLLNKRIKNISKNYNFKENHLNNIVIKYITKN